MIGQRLAQYQITVQLGAGAMGEVYRAQDSKLGRDVAVKVLPGNFAVDPERLRRFEQEARTLAALNHPNILAVFDTGVHDGSPYLVSELLEGQTLRDALKDGAMPPRRTLEYAVQIAHGLAAAHEKGIVHRDLKPENIFITRDGRVKILDFGLAKLAQVSNSAGDSPTLAPSTPTLAARTEPGLVLGTPGYMSPEQARGEVAEERSDIFSFGVILYEMLCGQRAFQGNSAVEVMHAILKSDPPDLAERVENLPPALDRVVRRCLEKRPERRFQTAADLAFALENSLGSGGSSITRQGPGVPRQQSVRRLVPLAVAVIGIVIGALGLYLAWNSSHNAATDARPAPVLRKLIIDPFQSNRVSGLTGGDIRGLSIAPDGKKLVFVNRDGLWLYWLDRVSPTVLLAKPTAKPTNPAETSNSLAQPFWSPQSDEVGYFDSNQLYRVPLTGGPPRLIATWPEAFAPTIIVGGGAWLADGRIVFTKGGSGISEVPAAGGDPTEVLATGDGEADFHNVCALPGGRSVLFVVHWTKTAYNTIAVWTPPGPKKVLLQLPGALLWGPAYSASGHIVFEREHIFEGIWAFPFSLEKLERTGEIFRAAEAASWPSLATDGTLVYAGPVNRMELAASRQMIWVDRTGKIVENVGPPATSLSDPRLSPDQRRIAVVSLDRGNPYILVFDTATSSFVRLTQTTDYDMSPFWYPDGSRILFNRPTASGFFVKAVDGFGEEQKLGTGQIRELSRSGKYLFARVERRVLSGPNAREGDVWAWRELTGKDVQFHPFPAELDPQDVVLSPNDSLLAYSATENGRAEVSIVDFPGFTVKTRVSHEGGRSMQWNPSGSELIYMSPDRHQLWSAALNRDGPLSIGALTKLCDLPESTYGAHFDEATKLFQVSADGQRFLMLKAAQPKSEQAPQQIPTLHLVENWFEEFREKK